MTEESNETEKQKQVQMSHEQQVANLQNTHTKRNGIHYDYRIDPDNFIQQKRLMNRQSVNQVLIDQFKVGYPIWKEGTKTLKALNKLNILDYRIYERYQETIQRQITNIKEKQKKCEHLRGQVIRLMIQCECEVNQESMTKKEREKLLFLEEEPESEEESQFQLIGKYQLIDRNQRLERRALRKSEYYKEGDKNFSYEGVYFNYDEDPNRFIRMRRQKSKQDIKLFRQRQKQSKAKTNKKIGQKKHNAKQEKSEQKNLEIRELQMEMKIKTERFQLYQKNLDGEVQRLEKKKSLLQEQKQKIRRMSSEKRGNQIQVNKIKGKQQKKNPFVHCYDSSIKICLDTHIEIREMENKGNFKHSQGSQGYRQRTKAIQKMKIVPIKSVQIDSKLITDTTSFLSQQNVFEILSTKERIYNIQDFRVKEQDKNEKSVSYLVQEHKKDRLQDEELAPKVINEPIK